MVGKSLNTNLKPCIQRITFSNTKLDQLERGDLLYFGYSGPRSDEIVNPLIIVAGYDTRTNLIYGSNIRMFFMEKLLNIGMHTLQQYARIYWDTVHDEDDEETIIYEKKKVDYTSQQAFAYENLDYYSAAIVNRLVGTKTAKVNLLKNYWRSYSPSNMMLLHDEFHTLTNNSISVNLEVANGIMNKAPTHIIRQPIIG